MTERRMDAYYYGFEPTGVDAVDKFLSAVAWAGKAYHHTDDWTSKCSVFYAVDDHTGESPVEWIQNAAREAAAYIKELEVMTEPLKFTDLGSFQEFSAMEKDRLRKRAEQLESGPGGIMEMKQTIADKEREIEYLQADIRFWQERYTHYTTTLQAEVDRLQKDLDLVYAYDDNLLDHLKGWK